MFSVALIVLVSICAVQSQDIYGDIDAVIPEERSYVQDLIDLPKPLDENMMVQRCGKQLAVTLNYLCPPHRRTPGPDPKKGKGKLQDSKCRIVSKTYIYLLCKDFFKERFFFKLSQL